MLARHFKDRDVCFTNVFSSDLDRATDTARGICQQQLGGWLLALFQTSLLKEQYFGTTEGTRWQSADPASTTGTPGTWQGGEQEESMASMRSRANSFLNDHTLPLAEN